MSAGCSNHCLTCRPRGPTCCPSPGLGSYSHNCLFILTACGWLRKRRRRLLIKRLPLVWRPTHLHVFPCLTRPDPQLLFLITPQRRDYFVDLVAGTQKFQACGVEEGMHDKHSLTWECWMEFTEDIGLYNPFMDQFKAKHKQRILCTFLHTVREEISIQRGHAEVGSKSA